MMARPRAPKNSEPETPPVEATPEGHDSVGGSSMSKAQAVRNALGEGLEDLGAIEGFVKSHYGIAIPRQMISAYKSQAKSKMASGTAVRGRKAQAAGAMPAPRKAARSGEIDVLGALEAMKPLVEALGADKVKRLVDLLG